MIKKQLDIKGVTRSIAGFYTVPNKNGNHELAVVYTLDPVPLSLLREIFNIPLNTEDPIELDMIYDYDIGPEQAQALQPYVKEKIDLSEYMFMLICRSTE